MDDTRQVLEIAARAEQEDGAGSLDEATLMALRAGELDSHVVAGGFTLLRPGQRTELTLVVDPDVRRQGLGHALLTRVEQSVEHSAESPLVAWSHGNHPAAARLAETHGWKRVRDLWVMRRSLRRDGGPLPSPAVRDGVAVRPFGDEDRDELLRVNAAAFSYHPEQAQMDADNLAARMAEPWYDPAGLLVAERLTDGEPTGELLGFHWTKAHSHALGEVYVVGIDPAAQGMGLGRMLTLAGLHHLERRRIEEVLLYVESDNEAAIRTYTKLGFTHDAADTHVMYERA